MVQQPQRILDFRTRTYARNVYIYGNTTLEAVPAEYKDPVMHYAAENFTRAEIDNALAQGWITQAEYDTTVSYIPV